MEDVNSYDMNICPPQDINTSFISYRDKQITRLGTCDDQAHLISIFGTNKYVATNNTNIKTFLLRIVKYVKDIKLSNEDLNALAILE